MIAPLLLVLPLLGASRGEISAGAGVSTNPFEVPSPPSAGGTAPEPGTYFPIRGFGVLQTDAQNGFRFGVRGNLDIDLFTWVVHDPHATAPTRPLDASSGSAALSAPADWITALRDRRLTVTVEPFVGMHRETFTSPLTGRPYVANAVSYARRFDTNRAGAKASAELEVSPTANVYGSLSWQRVDYVDDFNSVPGVDSWDYGELRLDADAWLYPSSGIFTAAYSLRRRAYDERYPHDSSGNAVLPGAAGYAPQLFWYHDGTIKAGRDGDRGRAMVRLEVERRIDAWGGYLDYTDVSLGLDLRTYYQDWTLSSEPELSFRRYDFAHVAYDPLEPVNSHVRLEIGGRIERRMRGGTSAFVEAGWTRQNSTNPLYDFDAVRISSGIRYSWR